MLPVPAQVTVPAGATSAAFSFSRPQPSRRLARFRVTAASGAVTAVANINVIGAVLYSFSLGATPIQSGSTVKTNRVSLWDPRPRVASALRSPPRTRRLRFLQ